MTSHAHLGEYLFLFELQMVTAGNTKLSLYCTSTLIDFGWDWSFWILPAIKKKNPPHAKDSTSIHMALMKENVGDR